MNDKIQKLINIAKQKMAGSHDLMHDLSHVKRVADYAKQISHEFSLSNKQKQALEMAVWWHDAGRTLKKQPSCIWMSFFDDLVSALMLWATALKYGLYGGAVGLSARIIVCKSLGTGGFLTRILLRRRDRFLVNIIKDADYLDLLNPERNKNLYLKIETSKLSHYSYRALNWWLFAIKRLKLKTQTAKQILKRLLQQFIAWIKSSEIYSWHIKNFGYHWFQKALERLEKIVYKIQCTA